MIAIERILLDVIDSELITNIQNKIESLSFAFVFNLKEFQQKFTKSWF